MSEQIIPRGLDAENLPSNPEEFNNVNPEIIKRILGDVALDLYPQEEYLVPVDPMDDLQCESCQ